MTSLDRTNVQLLLVEDNERYLKQLGRWLGKFGYKHIETARNVDEAKSKLDEKPFDVIVADMRLADDAAGGFAVLDEVIKRNLTSVVIILTANDTVKDSRKAFKSGVIDYISKSMKGNVFEELDQSIQQGIVKLNNMRSFVDLIELGESATLEFKSTLQWDVKRNTENKNLRFAVLKTITAFLNTEGGTLLIGVEDDGNIFGLERDISMAKGKTLDGFQNRLMDLINTSIGAIFSKFLNIRFEEVDGKQVCAVEVNKASKPVFMKKKNQKFFYIRSGNSSRSLDIEKTVKYIQMHWK